MVPDLQCKTGVFCLKEDYKSKGKHLGCSFGMGRTIECSKATCSEGIGYTRPLTPRAQDIPSAAICNTTQSVHHN